MNKELKLIFNKVRNKEPFALLRFGDGEKNILNNIACKRKGFSFDPRDIRDQEFQSDLIHSLYYIGGKNYFVGIKDKELEKEISSTIIDPMIFVNKNYLGFLKKFSPLFNNCVLIANEKSNVSGLPFKPFPFIPITNTYWRTDESKFASLSLSYWLYDKPAKIILVAGGAWSNVLIQQLWEIDKNHIYIDIGSVFDPFLFGYKTRKYQERLNHDS